MKNILDYSILQIGDYELKLSSFVFLAIFLIGVILFLQITKRFVFKAKKIDLAKKHGFISLIKYVTLVFSFVISLQILGFNLSVLIAGSAALLVGIGLGLQSLFNDFISGIILLVDSSVKVNDVIDVNGLICKVEEINLRTTRVLTRDDKYIILPNSDLTKNRLINWTHSNITSRFEVTVGVDYGSDVNKTIAILIEAAKTQKGVLKSPEPSARFNDYGESSLNFSVLFWSDEVFRIENIKSEIRIKIFELFKANNITIPFPQRVVHIKNQGS